MLTSVHNSTGRPARVVFDMAFRDPGFAKRSGLVATGAAIRLGYALATQAGTENLYLPQPYITAVTPSDTVTVYNLRARMSQPNSPDFYFMSYLSGLEEELAREVELIRMISPSTRILIGGGGVTVPVRGRATSLKKIATVFGVDGVVMGAGEEPAVRLVHALTGSSRGGPLAEWRKEIIGETGGCYFRDFPGGEFEHCEETANVYDAQTFNLFSFGDLSAKDPKLLEAIVKDVTKKGSLRLHSSYGCFGHCPFCASGQGQSPVGWDAPKLILELHFVQTLIAQGKLPAAAHTIKFTDDDFLFDADRAIEFFKLLGQSPELNSFSFSFESRADSYFVSGSQGKLEINHALFKALPCERVKLIVGVDGFSDRALQVLGKGRARMKEVQALQAALIEKKIIYSFYAILFPYALDRREGAEVLAGLVDRLAQPTVFPPPDVLSRELGCPIFYPELEFNLVLGAVPGTALYRQMLGQDGFNPSFFGSGIVTVPTRNPAFPRDPMLRQLIKEIDALTVDEAFLDIMRKDDLVWDWAELIFQKLKGRDLRGIISDFSFPDTPFRAMCFHALRRVLSQRDASLQSFPEAFALALRDNLHNYRETNLLPAI